MGSKSQLIQIAADRIGVSPTSDIEEMDRITERRHRERPGGNAYAWCGDFATYVLMLAGCHDGGALNRVALNGKWQPGDNIARLVRWAKGYNQFVTFTAAEQGDIIIFATGNGDHICFLDQPPDGGGIFYTIDGNHGNVVARAKRTVGVREIRCCISTGMLIQQTAPSYTSGSWIPFPVPELPTALPAGTELPFPVGWHYREDQLGSLGWSGWPWLEENSDERCFDGSRLTDFGRRMGLGIPVTPAGLAALAGSLGVALTIGPVTDMLAALVAQNGPRIMSPTDTITLGASIVDGVEEIFR